MKISTIVTLAQALAVYAQNDMQCDGGGADLPAGTSCYTGLKPFCCKKQNTGNNAFPNKRSCVTVKDGWDDETWPNCHDTGDVYC
ncbi:hypothetical protein BUE80_DR006951, partial [Diplocarpon rosae]